MGGVAVWEAAVKAVTAGLAAMIVIADIDLGE